MPERGPYRIHLKYDFCVAHCYEVESIVPDAKEDDEQMKNDDNNSDSDGAENENIYY